MCINTSFTWRRSCTSMHKSAESISRQKKERHCACKNIALSCPGWESNPRSLAQGCKKEGIGRPAWISSTWCNGFCDGQKYLNASHQIIRGGRVMIFVINLVYPIVNTTQYHRIRYFRTITVYGNSVSPGTEFHILWNSDDSMDRAPEAWWLSTTVAGVSEWWKHT
jgi:hypothetical protein